VRVGLGDEMNWRRGLVRLWLVLSLIWIVMLGILADVGTHARTYWATPLTATIHATAPTAPAPPMPNGPLVKSYADLILNDARTASAPTDSPARAQSSGQLIDPFDDPAFSFNRPTGMMQTFSSIDEARLERNIRKMVDLNAPETDIAAYLQVERVTPEMFRAMQERRRSAARQELLQFANLGLIPPVTLLVVGLGVGWALLGFRKT
jgi:hypothetical protein